MKEGRKRKEKARSEHYLDRLADERHELYARFRYSSARLDSLVITISAGGLYVVLMTIKELDVFKQEGFMKFILLSSGLLFLAAVLVNFIGQEKSRKDSSNKLDINLIKVRLEVEAYEDEKEKHEYEKELTHLQSIQMNRNHLFNLDRWSWRLMYAALFFVCVFFFSIPFIS